MSELRCELCRPTSLETKEIDIGRRSNRCHFFEVSCLKSNHALLLLSKSNVFVLRTGIENLMLKRCITYLLCLFG